MTTPSDDRRRVRVGERYWLTEKGWAAATVAQEQASRPAQVRLGCSACGLSAADAPEHVEYVRKHGVCIT